MATEQNEKQVSLEELQPIDDQAEMADQQEGVSVPVSELSPAEDEAAPEMQDEVPAEEPEVSEHMQEDQPESSGHKVYVAMDADDAGRLIGQAILNDDIESLEHTSHAINAGQNIILDWVEEVGGKVITAGGDEALVEIPLEAVDHLETLRQQYHQIVGATITAGVGLHPSEAGKALLYGKVNGKDQVAVYDHEMEQELTRVHEHPENEEEQKQNEHYLSGLYEDDGQEMMEDGQDELMPEDHEFEGDNYEQQGEEFAAPHEDFDGVDHDTEGYEEEAPEMDFMDEEFGQQEQMSPEGESDLDPETAAQVAEEAAAEEHSGQEGQEDEMQAAMKEELAQPESVLKQKLGELLEAYQAEKEQLEQLQQNDPELYQEVLGLLQQMIKVAKLMSPEGQEAAPDQMPPEEGAPAEMAPEQMDPAMGKQ